MAEPLQPEGAEKPRRVAVQLPHASVEDFVQKYSSCLTLGGIYLRVAPRPLAAVVQLEVRVRSGERVLFGLGCVAFVTGEEGQGHPGMGVRFVQLDDASRDLLRRACAGRAGAEAVLPPLPAGVGAARGEWAPQPATIFSARVESPPDPDSAQPPRPTAVVHVQSKLSKMVPLSGRPEGPVIGIDLGTTYTCVACVKGERPSVALSREGHRTFPSIVALNSHDRLVVGHPARNVLMTSPSQAIFAAKRLVGRPFHSPVVQKVKERVRYEIVEGPRGEAAVRLGGQVWSLHQISALLLLEAKEVAEHHLGVLVQRAVITVPAYYGESQRQAVRVAGEMAGLHVERILNEPTAAALAFGAGKQMEKTLLVYDLGGGTFDVSLLRLSGNVFEVISTAGDTFLGGVDFDAQIVDWLVQQIEHRAGADFPREQVALQRLADVAEIAKRELSEREETRIAVPFISTVQGKPFDLDVVLTRGQLDVFCNRLVDRTLEVCNQVLSAKGLSPKDVDEILLVGGMSRMPLIHDKIEQLFGKEAFTGVHPDESVALGAALYGHTIEQVDGVVLIDVLPMSIGIGLPGGRLKHIVERNTSLPHTKSYGLTTTKDGQAELELMVFQGDGDRVEQAEYLGTVLLAPLPRGPRGSVEIQVSFTLSAECLLTITAREQTEGHEVKATLTTRDTPDAVKAKLARASYAESRAEQSAGRAIDVQTATAAAALTGRSTLTGRTAATEPPAGWLARLVRKLVPGKKAS